MAEFRVKQERFRALLAAHHLDALLLRRVSSFAWATCGAASYVALNSTEGAAALLLTPSGRYVITDNVEATRLTEEEHLPEQGWQMQVHPWWETDNAVARLTRGLRLGADIAYPGALNLDDALAHLRVTLTDEEVTRFRKLGRLCADAMDQTARTIQPGMTEEQIAGLLDAEVRNRGMQAVVNLIGTDERIFRFRHPHPTAKPLERYALLGLCGRRWGLVCSVSRLVHFGPIPDEIRRKAEALAQVDAAFIAATQPGQTLGGVLAAGVAAYAEAGYPDEWHLHHQGGPAAYEAREYLARPDSPEVVQANQVYGWNPSITGTKSEDSILVTPDGPEILTETPGWPLLAATAGGRAIPRPAILERD